MANKHRTNLIYPIALMVLIFVESSIPMDGASNNIQFLTDLDPTVQNLLHIPLFGVLAFFWMNAFKNWGFGKRQAIIYGFCISVMYGALDEYHQSFVPGRYGGLLDIYLDTAGAFISCIVFWRFSGKRD